MVFLLFLPSLSLVHGKLEEHEYKNNNYNNKKQFAFSLLTALLLIIIVVAGTAFNEQSAAAATRTIPFHFTNSSPFLGRDYAKFQQYAAKNLWHYNYNKSEQQNQKDFDQWFCYYQNLHNVMPTECSDIHARIDI